MNDLRRIEAKIDRIEATLQRHGEILAFLQASLGATQKDVDQLDRRAVNGKAISILTWAVGALFAMMATVLGFVVHLAQSLPK